jgi:hypothetical protein
MDEEKIRKELNAVNKKCLNHKHQRINKNCFDCILNL